MKYLKVSFEKIEDIKKLGAKWDPEIKSWYCEELNSELFVFYDDFHHKKQIEYIKKEAELAFFQMKESSKEDWDKKAVFAFEKANTLEELFHLDANLVKKFASKWCELQD